MLRNALLPLVTMLGMDVAYLFGGAVLTETVFGIPGIGGLAWRAIRQRDLPMVMGTVLFAAIFIVAANLVVDLILRHPGPSDRARGGLSRGVEVETARRLERKIPVGFKSLAPPADKQGVRVHRSRGPSRRLHGRHPVRRFELHARLAWMVLVRQIGEDDGRGSGFEVVARPREAEGASDLHISTGLPPMLRLNGSMMRLDQPPLGADEVLDALLSLLSPQSRKTFQLENDLDFGFEIENTARYRANLFMRRRGPGAVFRLIPNTLKTLDELEMPKILKQLAMREKG